ncbi:unnamed protein product [Ascophyllum nodosum]
MRVHYFVLASAPVINYYARDTLDTALTFQVSQSYAPQNNETVRQPVALT